MRTASNATTALLPIMGAVFASFLVIGLALPVLPLHVHVRRAPADSRGLAMGAYTAFLDVALALASRLLGLLAAARGIGSIFLASALASLCAAPVALRFMKGSK